MSERHMTLDGALDNGMTQNECARDRARLIHIDNMIRSFEAALAKPPQNNVAGETDARESMAHNALVIFFRSIGAYSTAATWSNIFRRRIPVFEVGQKWRTRDGKAILTIVAVTAHETHPIVAQAPSGGAYPYRVDGCLACNEQLSFDLVDMVEAA